MSSSSVPLHEYISSTHNPLYDIADLVTYITGHMPEVIQLLDNPKEPGIAAMDAYYTSWIKRERRGRRIKKRHISRVTHPPLQYIHDTINRLFPLPSHACVYSYKNGLSTPDCAKEHVGAFALYKLDITDFFPSITRSMIYHAYRAYFDAVAANCTKPQELTPEKQDVTARLFALLCTRSDTRNYNTDEAVLPIGIAPASSISNHMLLSIDITLTRIAEHNELIYTRYSDNLFFSTIRKQHIDRSVQKEIVDSVEKYTCNGMMPFTINRKKTQYVPRWKHQRILGIVTNEKLNISRGKEKWLRSALNHLYYDVVSLYDSCEHDTADRTAFRANYAKIYRQAQRIFGQLAYVHSVAPHKYTKYSSQHHAIKLLLEECKIALETGGEQTTRTID